MSYTLAITDFRLPDDFDEAHEQVNPLLHQSVDEVAPVFVEFHKRVTAVYPCICDLPDDLLDDGVWSDGPLINNFKVKVPVIGFVYRKVAEAAPTVIQMALDAGLSVMDWQSGRIYNPD